MLIRIGAITFLIDNRLLCPETIAYLSDTITSSPVDHFHYTINLTTPERIASGMHPVNNDSPTIYQENGSEITILDTFSSLKINRSTKVMEVLPTNEQYLDSLDFITDLKLLVSLVVLEQEGILLHSSAVTYQGGGYAFTGPSGAGKSTLATLLLQDQSFEILNDEFNIIYHNNGDPTICATPFGAMRQCQSGTLPLRGLFFLQKSTQNSIRDLKHSNTTLSLIKHVCSYPSNDFYGNLLLQTVDNLAQTTSLKNLHFRKDESIPAFMKEYTFTPSTLRHHS